MGEKEVEIIVSSQHFHDLIERGEFLDLTEIVPGDVPPTELAERFEPESFWHHPCVN